MRKSALGRLLKPLFNLDDIEFPTENLLTPLKEGSTEVSQVLLLVVLVVQVVGDSRKRCDLSVLVTVL